MPIITIVRTKARPGQRDALIAATENVLAQMKAVKGFLGVDHYHVPEDPDAFYEIARWERIEDHKAFGAKAMESGLFRAIMDLLAERPSVTYLEWHRHHDPL